MKAWETRAGIRKEDRERGVCGYFALLFVLGAVLPACQDRREASDSGSGASSAPEASSEVPPAARDALTPAELAGIDVSDIRLTLPWNSGQTSRPGTLGASTLRVEGVETSTMEGMDRLLLRFSEGPDLPGYQVEYVKAAVDGCGQGRTVDSAAPAFLKIRFENVQAHDRAGAATFGPAPPASTGFPRLREIHMTCDSEAVVEWTLGVAAETSYRVLEVHDPMRIVLDVRD
jgi:hypothetical protein